MSGAPGRMDARETAAAVAVAVVWGLTFIAIKRGVAEIPPLMFSALRFLFAAVPAAFFLRPPKAAAWRVVAYGIVLGVGQFGLLFLAIRAGMPASLSAVVVQSQAFFTVALAAPLLGERPTPMQAIGGAVSLAGIVTMSIDRLGGASIGPFVMVVGGAFCWAIANVLAKGAARDGGGR
ncbi:MAG: EamA family transporter, partial [Hyphomicrobiales bacterium]|nr:EamA family transporter [Hyphomicrobiales bacterium]